MGIIYRQRLLVTFPTTHNRAGRRTVNIAMHNLSFHEKNGRSKHKANSYGLSELFFVKHWISFAFGCSWSLRLWFSAGVLFFLAVKGILVRTVSAFHRCLSRSTPHLQLPGIRFQRLLSSSEAGNGIEVAPPVHFSLSPTLEFHLGAHATLSIVLQGPEQRLHQLVQQHRRPLRAWCPEIFLKLTDPGSEANQWLEPLLG